MLKAFAGGRLFGSTHGSTPARVVALPGWRHDHRDFSAVLSGFDALAIDPPGFGTTPEPPDGWGAADYANAVAPVLEETSERVVLVGHSFGGRIGVHLAAQHPSRVAGLVLAGVPLLHRADRSGAKPPLGFRVVRLLHRRGIVSDDRMEAMRRSHGSADYRAASGVMREVLVRSVNESYEDVLGEVACRVELVWGAEDDQVPVEVAERAAALVSDGYLTVLPGVGHMVPVQAPDALRDAIGRCLT
ncbi:MAG: alpha/beta fold hydrolase [Acidimicrobiales bacterium]